MGQKRRRWWNDMDLSDLVHPAQVVADLRARDKAQLTAELSRRAAAVLASSRDLSKPP